jgi:hypothetical protein
LIVIIENQFQLASRPRASYYLPPTTNTFAQDFARSIHIVDEEAPLDAHWMRGR